ncbi:MAG: hypothetical protein ABI707_12490 [Ferruginibacter sp.]
MLDTCTYSAIYTSLVTRLLSRRIHTSKVYILRFVSGLDTISYTVQRLSSLSDIIKRIELETADFPGEVITHTGDYPLFRMGKKPAELSA